MRAAVGAVVAIAVVLVLLFVKRTHEGEGGDSDGTTTAVVEAEEAVTPLVGVVVAVLGALRLGCCIRITYARRGWESSEEEL